MTNPNIILQGQPVDSGNIMNSFLVGRKLALDDRRLQKEGAAEEKSNKLAQMLAATPKEKIADALYGQGMYKEAQDYNKNQADIAKVDAEAQIKQLEHRRNMVDTALQLANGMAQDPTLSKAKISGQLNTLHAQGLIDDSVLVPTLKELDAIPDDTLSLRQYAQGKQMTLMKAHEAIRYQMPDANAQLSAETSRYNANLDNQLGQQRLSLDLDKAHADQDYKAMHLGLKQPMPSKITEDQGKAMGWLKQADNAYKNILSVLAEDKGAMNPGVIESIAPDTFKGAFRDANRQKFVQASSSLSEALLRAATGAGITKDEAAQKIKEITPEYWDKPEVKEQKLDSIPVFLESLKTRAGQQASGYQIPGQGRGASESFGDVDPMPPKGIDPSEWRQFLLETGGK